MNKKIIICADDYAQSDVISDAILSLAKKNRISATSCMTNTRYWQTHARKLLEFSEIDKGLHLNFTHDLPLSIALKSYFNEAPICLSTLLQKIFLRQIPKALIKSEIHAQLDSFEQHLELIPDFIDGHQHIHHLPIIRNALIEVYLERYATLPYDKRPYCRVTISPSHIQQPFFVKKKIIQGLGAKTFKKMLMIHEIPHNKHFFHGVYPFTNNHYYPKVALPILETIDNGDLLMCHPGLRNKDDSDPISEHRLKEYFFLSSDEFYNTCKINQLEICRFER